jgi:S1-C subfamily serine protease
VHLSQEGDDLLIYEVTPEGPAAHAGLREGDLLLAVDGTAVASVREAFRWLLGAPNSSVVLTVRRKGTEQSVSVLRAP